MLMYQMIWWLAEGKPDLGRDIKNLSEISAYTLCI